MCLGRLTAVAGVGDDLDPVLPGEDRLERLGEEAVVVGYEDADPRHCDFNRHCTLGR